MDQKEGSVEYHLQKHRERAGTPRPHLALSGEACNIPGEIESIKRSDGGEMVLFQWGADFKKIARDPNRFYLADQTEDGLLFVADLPLSFYTGMVGPGPKPNPGWAGRCDNEEEIRQFRARQYEAHQEKYEMCLLTKVRPMMELTQQILRDIDPTWPRLVHMFSSNGNVAGGDKYDVVTQTMMLFLF